MHFDFQSDVPHEYQCIWRHFAGLTNTIKSRLSKKRKCPCQTIPNIITNVKSDIAHSTITLSRTIYFMHSKTSLSELGVGAPQFIVLISVSPNCTGTGRPWTIYRYGKDLWPEHHGKIDQAVCTLYSVYYQARIERPWTYEESTAPTDIESQIQYLETLLLIRASV
jgi:hypothetical protein